MLAAAVEADGSHGTGSVAVVALDDDPGARAAVDAVTPALAEPARLKFISLEKILEACDEVPPLSAWSAQFRRRYVGPLPD